MSFEFHEVIRKDVPYAYVMSPEARAVRIAELENRIASPLDSNYDAPLPCECSMREHDKQELRRHNELLQDSETLDAIAKFLADGNPPYDPSNPERELEGLELPMFSHSIDEALALAIVLSFIFGDVPSPYGTIRSRQVRF